MAKKNTLIAQKFLTSVSKQFNLLQDLTTAQKKELIEMQCCQAENQTKKFQNQTFIRPYFYQKSDQKRTQTRYFEVKIRLVPKT